MNAHFPRMISLLRKEQKLSQKQVAADLGISQALLSHYEKGIRECGLDFVVRIADYYSVSCDYLLGRSPDRSGTMLTAEDLPNPEDIGKESAVGSTGLMVMLNKKLISNSLYIVFDLASKTKSRFLIGQISSFLMMAVYRSFRMLYATNPKNSPAMFRLPRSLAEGYADAVMRGSAAELSCAVSGECDLASNGEEIGPIQPLELTTQSLGEDYPLFSASLLNLIKNAEEHLPHQKE